jgi:adenylate kinase family enzyme
MSTTHYDRIVIVGKPGSGKTTLARSLVNVLDLKHIELDAIFWQPNWGKLEDPDFGKQVEAALPDDGRWVVDGNYRKVRSIVWGRAETLIWLDFPLLLTLWRLLKRTLGRFVFRKELWNGNRENLVEHLTWNWDKNLFLFAIRAHKQQRTDYLESFKDPQYAHLRVLRFRNPKELQEWLDDLTSKESFPKDVNST